MQQERHYKYSRWRALRRANTTHRHRFLLDKKRILRTSRKLPHTRQIFTPERLSQSIGWISKTRQRRDAKNFQNFARRTLSPTDHVPDFKISRLFPPHFAFNATFMPATLELNISHNHLCDSMLRRTRNCIDAPRPKCKIELPKPQHVVSVRALDTIGCGS